MFSERFGKPVVITDHAREVRHKDETRIWIAKHYGDRADNLLCVVAALEAALVIKTVMHHFSWGPGS